MSYEGDLVSSYDAIHKRLLNGHPKVKTDPPLVPQPPTDKNSLEAALLRMRHLEERIALLEFKIGITHKTYPHNSQKVTLDEIFQLVRIKENYRIELLFSSQHAKDLSLTRQIIYYLQSTKTTKSYPEIGRYMHKDHSTILHGARKIAKLRQSDTTLNAKLVWYEAEIDRLTAIKNTP